VWTGESALEELVRGRLEALGPVTEAALAAPLGLPLPAIQATLAGLEAQGFAMRGHFTPGVSDLEWCDRRLLARIHRYTLDRLRKQIEPATAAEFNRFLFAWQRAHPEHRMRGPAGLAEVLRVLQGFEAPAAAWEEHLLPLRVQGYQPGLLDQLCLSGQVVWGRLSEGGGRRGLPTRASPIAFLLREEASAWLSARRDVAGPAPEAPTVPRVSPLAKAILEHLDRRGASFFPDLLAATRRLPAEIKTALGQLVAVGLVTGDSFGNLRSLLSDRPGGRRGRGWTPAEDRLPSYNAGGRWSLLRHTEPTNPEDAAELHARQLLRRYGVMFHRLSLREDGLPPWRDILRVYRRLEARGEIRGGRFVSGFTGEQYALPEAVEALRGTRKKGPDGAVITVSGIDPLNLAGITAPGDRVPAVATSRVAFRDGVPVAARVAGAVRYFASDPAAERSALLLSLRR
jgi:ATP-dependent Lhr-like helicase